LSGYFSAVGLIIIMVACLTIYGMVSFENNDVKDELQSSQGWQQFTSGWLVGSVGGASFAYILISNLPFLQTGVLK